MATKSRISKARSFSKSRSAGQKARRDTKKATAKAIGVATGKAGTSFKGFRSVKAAANAVRIKKAKRKAEILEKKAASVKAARSTKDIRLPVQGRPKPKPMKNPEAFSKESLVAGAAKLKQARVTKKAAQNLTRKRKAQQKRIDKK